MRLGEHSVKRIASDLGISDQTLRNWVKQADIDQGRREGVTTDEHTEMVRLRKRNRVLEMENAWRYSPASSRKPSGRSAP